MAAKRKGPRQDPLDAAEAAVGRLAAVGGLDLAVGAVWRFETPEPWSGARARTLLAAGAPAGAAILGRPGGRSRAATALWRADGRPLTRAAAASGAPADVWTPAERAARAARFCDGVATRLGVGRGAVAILVDPETQAAGAAALPMARANGAWRAAGPLVGGRIAAPSRRLAAGGAIGCRGGTPWDALVVFTDAAGALTASLPRAPDGDAFLELLLAVDETAGALDDPPMLEARWTPADPRLRRATLSTGGRDPALSIDPVAGLGLGDIDGCALAEAIRAAGGRMRAIEVALGDAAGGARTLGARPDAVARLVAEWLSRPGLGRALACAAPTRVARLDGRGAAAAAELACALAAAGGDAPDPLGLRLRGLAAALEGSELRLTHDTDGGATLRFRELAPPEDAAGWRSLALVLAALAARAGADGEAAVAPATLAAPRDLFCLPNPMWADAAGALADLAAAGAPTPSDALRAGWAARHPQIGVVDGDGLRLTATRAAETAPGAARAQILLEGAAAAAAALLVEGRRAPLARCPLTGGRLCGVRWQAAAAPASWAPALEPRAAIRLDAVEAASGRSLLAATLDLTTDPPRLAPADRRDGAPPPPARPSPFQPATVDLRAGP